MNDLHQPPLNWEASATTTHPQISSSLPSEVEACLKSARFVNLGYGLEQMLKLNSFAATSCNMQRSLSSRIANELYLPAIDTFCSNTSHYHDNQSIVQKDHESYQ